MPLWDAVAHSKVCTGPVRRFAFPSAAGEVPPEAVTRLDVPAHPSLTARFLAAAVRAGSGYAAGNDAIALSANAITAGEMDIAVCAGVDELMSATISAFTGIGPLSSDAVRPFDAGRQGTLPAEGAGVIVLKQPRHLAACGGTALATFRSHVSTSDAHYLTRRKPFGGTIVDPRRRCLNRSGDRTGEVRRVCAHGSSTPARDADLTGTPDAIVMSAGTGFDALRSAAARLCGAPCRHVEQQFGDLRAVDGLVASVSPATVRTRQHAFTLVVVVGETRNTVAVEVTTWNGDPRWT